MVTEINAMILDELDETDAPEEIKELLRKLLQKELEHRSGQRWWYKREYKPIINQLTNSYYEDRELDIDED